jgi:riboflavin synthase
MLISCHKSGCRVNIEVDIIARYLERLLQGKADSDAGKDSQLLETLIKSGFTSHE